MTFDINFICFTSDIDFKSQVLELDNSYLEDGRVTFSLCNHRRYRIVKYCDDNQDIRTTN